MRIASKQNIRQSQFQSTFDRREMASSSVVKLFHLFALGQFSFALIYSSLYIWPLEVKLRGFEFGGPLIYLTILAVVSFGDNSIMNFNQQVNRFSYQILIILLYVQSLFKSVITS